MLNELKKNLKKLDSGMQDAQNEVKFHNTLLEKMQTGIGQKFRIKQSELRKEMGLFELELEPSKQFAQRGQNFAEEEFDLFGLSA